MFAFWISSTVPVPALQIIIFSIIGKVFDQVQIKDEVFIVKQGLLLLLPYNIPDFVSFLIYLAMVKHFSRKIMPQQPVLSLEPYGGIWVGEVLDEVGIPPPPPPRNDGMNDVSLTMKVIRRQIVLSFMDFSTVLLGYFYCTPLGKPLSYSTFIFLTYWIPIIVVKSSIRQM